MRFGRLIVFVHELGVRLIVLRQAIHFRRNHRCEQANAVIVERHALTGRAHLLQQWVAVENNQVIFAVSLVLLNEGILRRVIA